MVYMITALLRHIMRVEQVDRPKNETRYIERQKDDPYLTSRVHQYACENNSGHSPGGSKAGIVLIVFMLKISGYIRNNDGNYVKYQVDSYSDLTKITLEQYLNDLSKGVKNIHVEEQMHPISMQEAR